jgi:aerobic-type carbon monoxide dehydrogenase small subunit (CoxS/CutS family)
VVVEGRAVRSCLVPLRSVEGKTVITIEGLAANGKLHPLQSAFVAHDALQCGICIPGMLMNAYALLVRHPDPSREQILRGMEGNICRCGAYRRILAAIQSAARTMREA